MCARLHACVHAGVLTCTCRGLVRSCLAGNRNSLSERLHRVRLFPGLGRPSSQPGWLGTTERRHRSKSSWSHSVHNQGPCAAADGGFAPASQGILDGTVSKFLRMRSFISTLGQLRLHHYYALFTYLLQIFSVAPLKGLLETVYFTVKGKCELAMKNLCQTKPLACCPVMANLPRGQSKILQPLLTSEHMAELWPLQSSTGTKADP